MKHNRTQAGIGLLERKIIDMMTKLGKEIFRSADLQQEFGYNRQKSNLILSRLTKKGWLQRLGPGLYRIVPLGADSTEPVPEDTWAIAMELFSPCYISGWTAAQHWDLTEQIFNTIVVVTVRKLRKTHHIVAGVTFKTKFTSGGNIFGTQKLWSGNRAIQIADLHRTIIDVLDDPGIGGGGRYMVELVKAYWQKKESRQETLLQYADKLNHGSVFKRLGFLGEKMESLSITNLTTLSTKINKGIILLDPRGPNIGPIITKWGIRVNIPLGDIL